MKNNRTFFAKTLVEWYKIHHRPLPWRETKDPYKIWLSEIILQQTRVSQGLPYYENFAKTYPTVHDLARADEQQVLRLWQGLGYYSRARNLHKCANQVVENFSGSFPKTFEELKSLIGIGNYTAAAIASFAFDQKVAVVDGNVYRVLSRVFGMEDDIATPAAQKLFFEFANTLLPDIETETYNQAIMEFGALQCVPSSPDCSVCPLANICFAKKHDLQAFLPVKKKTGPKKERFFNYLVLQVGKKLVLRERTESDIWKNLYEFPLQESAKLWKSEKDVRKSWPALNLTDIRVSKAYKHVLSHQNLHALFWIAKIDRNAEVPGKALTISEINELPKPVLITRFLEEYMK